MNNQIILLSTVLLFLILFTGCKKESLESEKRFVNYTATVDNRTGPTKTIFRADSYERCDRDPLIYGFGPCSAPKTDLDIRINGTDLDIVSNDYSLELPGEIQNGVFEFTYEKEDYVHEVPQMYHAYPRDSMYTVASNDSITIHWDGPPLKEGEFVIIYSNIDNMGSTKNVGDESITVHGKNYNDFVAEVKFQRSKNHDRIEDNDNLVVRMSTYSHSETFKIRFTQ